MAPLSRSLRSSRGKLLASVQFAPRDRATKVNLPGRIGKTSFNAYDADAAAADAIAAPTAAEPNGIGMLGSVGNGSPSGGGRRASNSASARQGTSIGVPPQRRFEPTLILRKLHEAYLLRRSIPCFTGEDSWNDDV